MKFPYFIYLEHIWLMLFVFRFGIVWILQELAALLNKSAQNVNSSTDSLSIAREAGRLVYLSIPPSSYPETSKLVNQYLRPKIGRPWFRVVLEKPFGRDLVSAKKLAAALESHFDEDEIYRIDHYLGKAVVQEILPFRYLPWSGVSCKWRPRILDFCLDHSWGNETFSHRSEY